MTDQGDADELRLRREVIRLIRVVEESWGKVGERVGPLLIMDENDPETAIPLAQCQSLSGMLCKAISAYTLHVDL